jgi:hypothetical protein
VETANADVDAVARDQDHALRAGNAAKRWLIDPTNVDRFRKLVRAAQELDTERRRRQTWVWRLSRKMKVSTLGGMVVAAVVALLVTRGVDAGSRFTSQTVHGPSGQNCAGRPAVVATAWGPARRPFSMSSPAPFATIDGITNNPNYGDERAFFDMKPASNRRAGGFCDILDVHDGELIFFRLFVENSAADGLAASAAAHDLKFTIVADSEVSSLRTYTAELTASDTTPRTVVDQVALVGDEPVPRGRGAQHDDDLLKHISERS